MLPSSQTNSILKTLTKLSISTLRDIFYQGIKSDINIPNPNFNPNPNLATT